MKYEEMGYDPKDLEDTIVDAPSSGFKKCPICGHHSLRENGWCDNGCFNNED